MVFLEHQKSTKFLMILALIPPEINTGELKSSSASITDAIWPYY